MLLNSFGQNIMCHFNQNKTKYKKRKENKKKFIGILLNCNLGEWKSKNIRIIIIIV